MSWWQVIGRGDDVIGDRPADIIATAFNAAGAGSLPSLACLLGVLEAVIAKASSELADPPAPGAQVVAVDSRGQIVSAISGADQWVAPLSDAVRRVADSYRGRFERNPRTAEVLACFAFVLRPKYDDLSRLQIKACPG